VLLISLRLGAPEAEMNNEMPPDFPAVPSGELISSIKIPSVGSSIYISRWQSILSVNDISAYYLSELRERFQISRVDSEGAVVQIFFKDTRAEYGHGRIEVMTGPAGKTEAVIYLGIASEKLVLYKDTSTGTGTDEASLRIFFMESSIPRLPNMHVLNAETNRIEGGQSWTINAIIDSKLNSVQTSLNDYFEKRGFQTSTRQANFLVIFEFEGHGRWGTIVLKVAQETTEMFAVVTDSSK